MKRAALRQDEIGLKRPRRNTRGRIKERKGGRRVVGGGGGGGGEGTLKETSQCWYLGVCPHIHQCGNQLSPWGWTSRRAKESTPPTPVEVLSQWGPDLPCRQRGCPVEQSLNLYAKTPSQFTPHKEGTTWRQDPSAVVMCARPSNENARLQKL